MKESTNSEAGTARPQVGKIETAPPRKLPRIAVYVAVALALCAGVALAAWQVTGDPPVEGSGGTATVRRDDLVITVSEGGSLKAKNSEEIVNKVEGRTTIVELVPEGTHVKKGDLLVKLDSADLLERKAQEEASLNTRKADYLAAKESYEIQKSLRESEVNKTRLKVKFAKMDLKKYIEGDWPQQLNKAKADINIARQELIQATNRLEWTQKLNEQKIATDQELEADQLAVEKAKISLEQAEEALRLLKEYENPKQREKLASDVEEAEAELDRIRRQQDSEVAQKKATLDARKTNYELKQSEFNKLIEQIEYTEIRAPQDGLIVYWTPRHRWSDRRPAEVGGEVRHRQTLMTLPDLSQMEIDVKIHEAQIDRIRDGLPCTIAIDAFPDRRYTGKVESIAVMADSQRWFNPDVKVYNTVVSLEQETEGLKPGMSANVEIQCDVIKDALLVPVTGVHVLRGRTAALVSGDGGFEVRQVRVGPSNDKFVCIEDGLRAGEEVLLFEPDNMPKIPWKAPAEDKDRQRARVGPEEEAAVEEPPPEDDTG